MARSSLYPKSEGYSVAYYIVADLPRSNGTKGRVFLSRELSSEGTYKRVLKRVRRRWPTAYCWMSVLLP